MSRSSGRVPLASARVVATLASFTASYKPHSAGSALLSTAKRGRSPFRCALTMFLPRRRKPSSSMTVCRSSSWAGGWQSVDRPCDRSMQLQNPPQNGRKGPRGRAGLAIRTRSKRPSIPDLDASAVCRGSAARSGSHSSSISRTTRMWRPRRRPGRRWCARLRRSSRPGLGGHGRDRKQWWVGALDSGRSEVLDDARGVGQSRLASRPGDHARPPGPSRRRWD